MRHRILILPLKRKRQGKTDFRLRFRLISSGKPRLVVRRSLKNLLAQIVLYERGGDKVVASAHSNELKKYGLIKKRRNLSVAYFVGYLAGMKARQKNIKEAVFDMGLYKKTKGSVLFGALKGTIDSGIQIPHAPDILPPEERIKGKHLKDTVSFDAILKAIQQKFGQ